ncbi:MAG: hypothetical protein ABEI27_09325 [Halobellus sp.]|uniref:hypothetical protein n=1 Tax=Halobellus sp. TaxID=1979212 RepID=UPI0035D3E0B6
MTQIPGETPSGRRLLALLFVFALVASASGSATTALLSDRESVSVGLTVEADQSVSEFRVQPLETCEVTEHPAAYGSLSLAEWFDVVGDGCAQVSVWISQSWVDGVDVDPHEVVIGHRGPDGWTYLQTEVRRDVGGHYLVEATTDGFSPFGLFVPNASVATDANATAVDGTAPTATDLADADGRTSANGTNATAVAGNESATGGGATAANGTVATNGTADGGTPVLVDETSGNESTGNESVDEKATGTASIANASGEKVISSEPAGNESATGGGATDVNGSETDGTRADGGSGGVPTGTAGPDETSDAGDSGGQTTPEGTATTGDASGDGSASSDVADTSGDGLTADRGTASEGESTESGPAIDPGSTDGTTESGSDEAVSDTTESSPGSGVGGDTDPADGDDSGGA